MNATTPILPQTASDSGTPPTTGNALPTSQGLNNMFLQLLVAQLQNQSPLNPMDPTQFVGQLAQFSELSEVTQIDQLLQKLAPSSTATGSKPPATGDSAESRSTALAPVPAAMLSSAVAAARAAIPNSTSPVAPLLNHKIQGVF